MKNSLAEKLKRVLSNEIAIEYKASLYTLCIMVFYCIYLLCCGIYSADIFFLLQMFCTAYVIVYIQYYLLGNPDEAERLGLSRLLGILCCVLIYTVMACFWNWFDRNLFVTALFFVYMISIYLCVFLVNKIKRVIDTNRLNHLLTEFKKGEVHE